MSAVSTVGGATPRNLSPGEQLFSALLRALPFKHGKHRILDRIRSSAWIRNIKPVKVPIRGTELVIDPNDLVGWHFAMLRSFDPEVVEVLELACDPGTTEVFWDIGANKGACSYSLAARVESLRIVAIEPQSALAANNVRNLEATCPGRYEYIQAGVGEEAAELELVIPSSNLGEASLHASSRRPDDRVETIRVIPASRIAENSRFGWPTLVKIDVEGHELPVIRSLFPCIESGLCKAIVFENHASEKVAFETIRSLVGPHGYDIYGIRKSPWSTRLVPASGQLPRVTDYVIVKRALAQDPGGLGKLIV